MKIPKDVVEAYNKIRIFEAMIEGKIPSKPSIKSIKEILDLAYKFAEKYNSYTQFKVNVIRWCLFRKHHCNTPCIRIKVMGKNKDDIHGPLKVITKDLCICPICGRTSGYALF
jgi:hypothetical protein